MKKPNRKEFKSDEEYNKAVLRYEFWREEARDVMNQEKEYSHEDE